jgi:hypothetical protein
MKDNKTAGTFRIQEENAYNILVGKPNVENAFWRQKCWMER